MNLGEFRQHVVKTSGRYDLVEEDFSDKGMNFYINAGQRFLDDKLPSRLQSVKANFTLERDNWLWLISPVKVIIRVYIGTSGYRQIIEYTTQKDMRNCLSGIKMKLPRGMPKMYARLPLRQVPDFTKLSLSDAKIGVYYLDTLVGNPAAKDGILFYPIADKRYHIEMDAFAYSSSMIDDNDTSFWSENHPDILAFATYRQMEIDNRNTEGVKDWTYAINESVKGIITADIQQDLIKLGFEV